ncbi:rab-gap tbc domain [Trichoderma arundinaceum]|uniref:Rab-gap tbc domain n=1 Tax=Trichoderma arundinaceum TaxID=490622 RepID=A0A395NZU2_TRIAR|nr:rab-gap tbc domain [Trichoderma arundinaceum]
MDSGEKHSGHEPSTPTLAPEAAPKIVDDAEAATPKTIRDSMVTVRLSEPPALSLDTSASRSSKLPDSPTLPATSEPIDESGGPDAQDASRNSTATLSASAEANRSLQDELGDFDDADSDCSDPEEVNWAELEKTEDEQTKDEETDNSTALLLARLEQENAKLATNPKTVKVQLVEKPPPNRPRPPSMAKLRKMVRGPTPAALRYSMLPPPPMTDLEFYAALVKDYQQTAARLPTLLSNKIRKGIPPPLRGVVWQSMSGSRDHTLEEQYERLNGESSPYEGLIGKDLGRSFPGVDMFRDPDGDGQRMLGRVLKTFSLYDTKIGYCQGLAFLVGPLLMHMNDKQAFCVLVRLMDRYDLRSCFLPDLSGLHVRIYQFRELLRANLPLLWSHLEDLQVETAYVSQWFLSFFATTCPLPMLFRIYDVIFAEGASETLMRVALSLMRRNEARLLSCTELEDVMQLLLSRGLWDCYHYNADEFVHDFASLTSTVTREKLAQLEQGYRESLVATANTARTSDIATAAARFLGRIWASGAFPRSSGLAPGLSAPSRPLSMLRRSTSKQSLASTLNSVEASSVSVMSSSSTDATTVSRDSSNTTEDDSASRESTPVAPKVAAGGSKNTDDKYLHSQIEDLLTALSELQRNHALLSNELKREREERDEDRKAVRSLLDGLRKKASRSDEAASGEEANDLSGSEAVDDDAEKEEGDEAEKSSDAGSTDAAPDAPSTEALSELLDRVESRFGNDADKDNNNSSSSSSNKNKPQSPASGPKSQLQVELDQAKDQLASAMSQNQDFNRRIHDLDQEMSSLKEQLRESHGHVRTLHQDKQRLEKQIQVLRARPVSGDPLGSRDSGAEWTPQIKNVSGGLREFKLGRSKSFAAQGATYNNRKSSLVQSSDLVPPPLPVSMPATPLASNDGRSSTNDLDTLLLELAQAKTAQAIAKQEAEEAKQKLETLKRTYSLPQGDAPNTPLSPGLANAKTAPPAATTSPGTGGFWGWRR